MNVVRALAEVVANKLGIILILFLSFFFLPLLLPEVVCLRFCILAFLSFLGGQQACEPVKLQLICGNGVRAL